MQAQPRSVIAEEWFYHACTRCDGAVYVRVPLTRVDSVRGVYYRFPYHDDQMTYSCINCGHEAPDLLGQVMAKAGERYPLWKPEEVFRLRKPRQWKGGEKVVFGKRLPAGSGQGNA